ncbi:hypothetical protein M1116_00095 [Patescibacteria group bacterium]|nr:hypothetical protein [Patescibacteria group bacterium]
MKRFFWWGIAILLTACVPLSQGASQPPEVAATVGPKIDVDFGIGLTAETVAAIVKQPQATISVQTVAALQESYPVTPTMAYVQKKGTTIKFYLPSECPKSLSGGQADEIGFVTLAECDEYVLRVLTQSPGLVNRWVNTEGWKIKQSVVNQMAQDNELPSSGVVYQARELIQEKDNSTQAVGALERVSSQAISQTAKLGENGMTQVREMGQTGLGTAAIIAGQPYVEKTITSIIGDWSAILIILIIGVVLVMILGKFRVKKTSSNGNTQTVTQVSSGYRFKNRSGQWCDADGKPL